MFSVNDHLARTDAATAADEPAKIPTDHIFTMTGIANQSMSVLSTELLPGTVPSLCLLCLSLCLALSQLVSKVNYLYYNVLLGKSDGRVSY